MNSFQKNQSAKILASYGINIQKSDDQNDLEKSEGSRGGKVIGHTRSGKAIYENHNHEGHKNFTHEDHNDASNAHSKIIDKMKGNDPKMDYHSKQVKEHYDKSINKQEHISFSFDFSRKEGGSAKEISEDYGVKAEEDGDEMVISGSKENVHAFAEDYGLDHLIN
jgi:hypothetical protein